MTAAGLVATAAGAKVHVADTTFDSDVVGASFAGVTATLERVTAGHNSYIAPTLKVGIQIGAQARVALRNSSIAHNYDGIVVDNAAGSTTTLTVDSTLIVDNYQGVHVTASGAGSMALVDIIRSAISGYIWYGVVVDATAPAVAAVTLSANDISRHIYAGVSAKNSGALVLATGNTLSRNGTTGLEQSAGAVLQSLGNNTIEPAAGATVGTITHGQRLLRRNDGHGEIDEPGRTPGPFERAPTPWLPRRSLAHFCWRRRPPPRLRSASSWRRTASTPILAAVSFPVVLSRLRSRWSRRTAK